MSFSNARPRARTAATENLLRKVEERSIVHISRLSNFYWPTNSHDEALALQVVFNILENEEIPSNDPFSDPPPDSEPAKQKLKLIRHLIDVLHAPQVLERRPRDARETIGQVFVDHRKALFRWLNFIIKESRWVYGSEEASPGSMGPMLATSIIVNVASGTRDLPVSLTLDMGCMAILMSSYTWRSPVDGKSLSGVRWTTAKQPCAPALLLSSIAQQPHPNALHAVMGGYNTSQCRRFIEAAIRRVEEYTEQGLEEGEASFDKMLPMMVIETITLVHYFLDVPKFAKACIQTRFAPRVLKLAMERPDLTAKPVDGRYILTTVPYPLAISIIFFPNEPGATPPYIIHHAVPQILDAGLLRLLVDHLLSLSPGTPHPWFAWVGREVFGHPLPVLASMCVYRPIFDATRSALREIPHHKLEKLTTGWYSEHWMSFYNTVQFYERMWDCQEEKVSLCDNLNHHKTTPWKPGEPIRSRKECSHCRSYVYCSTECQREDWEKYHRTECSKQHMYSLERRLAGAWVDHRHRAFYLSLLQHFVCNTEAGIPLEKVVGRFDDKDKDLYVVEHPVGWQPDPDVEIQNAWAIVQFNTLHCPPKGEPIPIDMFGEMSHAGVYTYAERRFKDIIAEFDRSQNGAGYEEGLLGSMKKRLVIMGGTASLGKMRVAACIGFCGTWRIYVVGRLEVLNDEKRTAVRLLNGFVKIEKRADLEVIPGVPVPLYE